MMHRMLAHIGAPGIDDESALIIAAAAQAPLHALDQSDVLDLQDLVDIADRVLLLRGGLG